MTSTATLINLLQHTLLWQQHFLQNIGKRSEEESISEMAKRHGLSITGASAGHNKGIVWYEKFERQIEKSAMNSPKFLGMNILIRHC
jgi:hypothetical protein